MKYYIIAGEASGDLHGSNLVKELRREDPQAQVRCWGGDLMAAAGGEVVKHYRDLAFMGFAEVVQNLPTILRNLKFCKEDVARYRPDVLVLVDYPGFNLRIAKWAKAQGFKVVYYISPTVWAWKENRIRTIRKVVDKMLVILPFEESFYRERDYKVEYVGHPLVQVVNEFLLSHPGPADPPKNLVALLPGSRKQEIVSKLPIMLEAAKACPQYQFVVARAPGLDEEFYRPFLQPYANVRTVDNQTYALLAQASAALVASGTATLETALFGVPQVVCYKTSTITYEIARRLLKIKYISLVNLIMDKPVVSELIQHDLTVENVVRELRAIMEDGPRRQGMLRDYEALRALLQQGGNASAKAARSIVRFLETTAAPTA